MYFLWLGIVFISVGCVKKFENYALFDNSSICF